MTHSHRAIIVVIAIVLMPACDDSPQGAAADACIAERARIKEMWDSGDCLTSWELEVEDDQPPFMWYCDPAYAAVDTSIDWTECAAAASAVDCHDDHALLDVLVICGETMQGKR